jgi:cytochrome c oxidase cbb3-type subunit III
LSAEDLEGRVGASVNAVRYFPLFVFLAWTLAPSFGSQASQTAADEQEGKHLFEQNCSACHGVDGGGGDGPSLHGVVARTGDAAVEDIIRRGIPGTAMPGSSTLSQREVVLIATYVRSFDSTTTSSDTVGDPKKGEALYNTSGCSGCHMIAGEGGSIGPDLSRIGTMRGTTNLKARLIDPGQNLPKVTDGVFGNRWTQYLMYRAVDENGRVIEGVRVGEDSFTIVLKDSSGKFHGLWKPSLRSLEKEPGKSFMPSYKGTLSDAQLDDLVAYLASLKGTP